jgi:hypothetical protein
MDIIAVSVEYILAGMLALSAFLLPFIRNFLPFGTVALPEGLIAVALAYLAGVVFDKLADEFLKPFERWLRLKEANRKYSSATCLNADPFPQNALEFSMREENNGSLQWMNSLRSRVRCARALAVFGVPAAFGLTYYFTASVGEWPCAVAALSLLLVCAVAVFNKKLFPVSKTHKLKGDKGSRENFLNDEKKRVAAWCCTAAAVMLVPACAIIVILVGQPGVFRSLYGTVYSIGLGTTGVILAVLSFWAWVGTTTTYLKYIHLKLPDLLKAGKPG